MGRNRSSSKRKSSKRKSSKISVEARKKKKNRTTKLKKLRHPKDSSCSSDDSRSSVSISSSSSEDEYHRACSRRQSELKGSRKRARERSSTRSDKFGKIKKSQKKKLRRVPSFTSIRSDSCGCSTNSGRSGTRKKLRKKRRKREPSVTSITSDSHIFSTCRGGFSSDENSKLESHRGRSREKSKGERDSDKTKSMKVRSRSCSSSGRYDDSDSGKLILPVENSSRRLRSVITVVKSPEDAERECDQDGLKEEIVQDHNDYPSCRSNDSTDGGNKRELADCSHADLEIREVEILKRQEDSVFDFGPTDLTKGGGSGGVVGHLSSLVFDGAGINNSVNENKREASPILNNRKNDDLESVLRLKALENLKKYRGAQQTKTKTPMRLGSLKVEEQSPTAVVTSESESSTLPNKTRKADLLVAESTVNNNSGLTSERMGQKLMSNNDDQDKNVLKSSICEPCSSLKPTVEEQHQSTDKDGSQFQQKTMSVMRGGEMVQVSYKVYIPKKAPALARRPLRR